MVRALLDGTKTQTRRLCPTQPFEADGLFHSFYPWGEGGHGIYETEAEMRAEFDPVVLRHCRWRPGDRLWVRETWREGSVPMGGSIFYRADEPEHVGAGWKPSIYMPRWACRLKLDVVATRIERLQDISERDACAEGMGSPLTRDCKVPKFKELWDKLNSKRAPWASNPLVFVVTFQALR
jgi:hypothetical protein